MIKRPLDYGRLEVDRFPTWARVILFCVIIAAFVAIPFLKNLPSFWFR